MAITKILNIMESEGRNPASHLKNALEYIQNPDKTEECVLVGGINCLPDTAFEQMEETKNIFHKTGKRQGYHVIISFSPEEKVTAEQAMYVLEHFAKDVLGDDYEAVYAVHTDREHMHGHLIWNTTGKKYNSPKGNWKNHLQPVTNKYCDELGLSIHRKATGRIIFSLLQINIVMNLDFPLCRQSTAGIQKISAGTSGKRKCQ